MLADELCEPLVNQLPEPNQFLLFNHCSPIQIDEENQSNERRVNTDKGVLADELRGALMKFNYYGPIQIDQETLSVVQET